MPVRILRVAAVLASVLVAPVLHGGAYEFAWRDARAAALGGACVAYADVASVSCNPGAMALLPRRITAAAGLTSEQVDESFTAGGVAGSDFTVEQDAMARPLLHAYVAIPVGTRAMVASGFHHSFNLESEWREPEMFAGRFVATGAEIRTYDVDLAFAVALTDSVALGVGSTFRSTELAVSRRLGAIVAGLQRDIGDLTVTADPDRSFAWSAGLLLKPRTDVSMGVTYRQGVTADVAGHGHLQQITTGDAQFDSLVRASFPYDERLPVSGRLRFPSQVALGVAWTSTERLLLAFDATRTSWSDASMIELDFANAAALNSRYDLAFHDSWTYRAGVEYTTNRGNRLRTGVFYDETPQSVSGVGAFLADADRLGVTAGIGVRWIDLSIAWTRSDEREVTMGSTAGAFRANGWLATVTITR